MKWQQLTQSKAKLYTVKLNIISRQKLELQQKLYFYCRFLSKKLYHKKDPGKIIGINIRPELPKNSDITIINSFNQSSEKLAKNLIKKINNLIYRLEPNDKEVRILCSIISSLSKNNINQN